VTSINLNAYKRAKILVIELKAINDILMKCIIDLMKYDKYKQVKEIQLYLRSLKLSYDKELEKQNEIIKNGKMERSIK
jgi:hypothetical protein